MYMIKYHLSQVMAIIMVHRYADIHQKKLKKLLKSHQQKHKYCVLIVNIVYYLLINTCQCDHNLIKIFSFQTEYVNING